MIRTILSWLRGPIVASTEADYALPMENPALRDYLAEARADAAGDPVTLPERVTLLEWPCWNDETKRGLTRHFYGRVGTRFVREPQCLNCGNPNPAMVVAK